MPVDIASALGIGSGINTAQLVSDLVAASRDPKQTLITSRVDDNNAKISALASAKSALSTFTNALSETLSSASYSGQPVSNDTSVASVSLIEGGVPSGLPAQLEVLKLAQAQVVNSLALGDATTATVGKGNFTLTTAAGSFNIAIDDSNNTLNGLAAAINAKNSGTTPSGVTASVVTDNQGARLVLKGAMGAANAFTLAVDDSAEADLKRFAFDGTNANADMTRVQGAQDAQIKIDGVEMFFSDNVVKTAIPYVRIDLNQAAPGKPVTLASDEPTSSVSDLVQEFVTAYNTLRSALNGSTAAGDADTGTSAGALAGDSGVRAMKSFLSDITSTVLSANGPYKTLLDIGIKTNRDGTLAIDRTKLKQVLADNPQAVTQMLNPSVKSDANPGLAGAMQKISDKIVGTNGALVASENKYTAMKKSLVQAQTKLDDQMSSYEERLTNTYSKMQAQLTALKATQTYISQQVSVWTNSNN
ncbi:MAG: flagellar filament capping protein FliD [Sphingobium sp.]|nr:flagellar filament capping protein FliD [Sphingobium sp.]